jgi:hypothetical protein
MKRAANISGVSDGLHLYAQYQQRRKKKHTQRFAPRTVPNGDALIYSRHAKFFAHLFAPSPFIAPARAQRALDAFRWV